MVSFRPSLIRSRSCSSGAYLVLSLSVFSLSFRFLINRFRSGSGYSASVSSFPLSSRFCLTAASPVRPFCFRFFGFPRSFRPGFPCLLSRFFVLGFSAFPFSVRPLASQWLPERLTLLPFGFRPLPLGFRFRFWLLGFRIHLFEMLPVSSSFIAV